jgi:NADP-dependent 3-hydroxy acid dehydrogenase YdfG
VALTYRNKAVRAEAVGRQVEEHGVRALPIRCDLTKEADIESLILALQDWSPTLHVLVLNASGGLERDLLAADPSYPMRINRDAQVALLEATLPLLVPGGSVVFVTSHWAHLYGRVEQLPAYEPVAESKWAGEQALRARQPALQRRRMRLLVVTGDLVEGTITPKLLERAAPGMTAQRKGRLGTLPTADTMAEAIAAAIQDPSLPNGHTVVVGGAPSSLTERAPDEDNASLP